MFLLVTLLQGLLGGLSAYVIHTSPEILKMKAELGGLAGQSSLTSEVISELDQALLVRWLEHYS